MTGTGVRPGRRTGYAGLLTGAVLALSACSQVTAIAPVGGGRLATVRFATNDVLVQSKVLVLVAPTCAESGKTITCTGSTVDGTTITATSDAASEDTLTVTVGGNAVYTGPIADVIERAARPTS